MAIKNIKILVLIGVIVVLVFFSPLLTQIFYGKRIIEEAKMSDEIFYFKNLKRGLNFELTVLSKSSRKKIKYDDKTSFVYTSGETLFYKLESDTLLIYTMYKAEYPERMTTNVVILQKEITNPKFIELKNSYKDLGLRKFPE